MRAIVYHRYGSPDVLRGAEMPRPSPGPNDVLVRVVAAAANPADWHLLRADPFLVRIMGMGLFAPKRPILGADVAGVVEEVGARVTRFRPGDEVFGGSMERGSGAFAEFVTVPEDELVPKPPGLDFERAAALPMGVLTALVSLRDVGGLEAGQRVIVQGASGGVGCFAVQLAKLYGAEVTAVTSTRNLDFVRSLGADHVIDYTRGDWTEDEETRYDLILAVCGYHPLTHYARRLTERGVCVGVGGSNAQIFEALLLGPVLSLLSKKKFRSVLQSPGRAHFEEMARWAERGVLQVPIDRRYTLDEVPDALRYLEQGHARGKVVIRVAEGARSLEPVPLPTGAAAALPD